VGYFRGRGHSRGPRLIAVRHSGEWIRGLPPDRPRAFSAPRALIIHGSAASSSASRASRHSGSRRET